MYWVYSLPNWLFGLLTVGLFVAFSLAGLFPSRAWIRGMHVQRPHNDIVGFYLAGITVLYGVSLGLLAIGAWTTYTDTEAKVSQEAAALSTLYRSVSGLPEPPRSLLQNDLRLYTREVIDVEVGLSNGAASYQLKTGRLWINSKGILRRLSPSPKNRKFWRRTLPGSSTLCRGRGAFVWIA